MARRFQRTHCGIWLAALIVIPALTASGATQSVNPGDPAAKGTNPHTLYLKTGDVDLAQAPSLLGSDTPLPADRRFVIHLDGPITPQRRDALEQAGVHLGEYLPMHAYICAAPGVKPTELANLGFVYWLGDFDADWRIAPDIGTVQFKSDERKALAAAGQARVLIELLPGADAGNTVDKLADLQALVLAIEPVGESLRIEAEVAFNRVAELKSVSDILFVEEVDEPQPRDNSANWISQSNTVDTMTIWDAGITGTGQTAGIIDWSMVITHCTVSDAINPIGPLHRKIQSYLPTVPGAPGANASHGATVTSILAGDAPGQGDPDYRGIAYNARVVFQDINQNIIGGSGAVDLLKNRLTLAHNDGARLHSNSWGGSFTTYTNWARDIDLFSRMFEDDVVCQAPPNGGTVTNPENAKNCLAVSNAGDSPNQDNICLTTATPIGPTADGRRKPDLTAVGCGMTAANYLNACGLWSAGGATSWACPVGAGLGVLTRQYFTDGYYPTGAAVPGNSITPSGALLRAMLVNSSVDLSGVADYPNMREGWGRILLDDALYLPGDARKLLLSDVRNAVGLSTGQSNTVTVTAIGGAIPLKITLVWTDVAASALAAFTPVNNLDLIVTAPDATVYRGNVFAGGQSAPGGVADDRNNVEQVIRLSPLTGNYTIQIQATAVNAELQGYALVVTGDIIPTDCSSIVKGDVNLDGMVNGRDIHPFVGTVASFSNVITTPAQCAADIGGDEDPCSADGQVNAYDVPGFVALLLTGGCP